MPWLTPPSVLPGPSPLAPPHPGGDRSSPLLPGGLPPSLHFCLGPATRAHFKRWAAGLADIPSLTFVFTTFQEYITLAYESLGQDIPSTHPHPNTHGPHCYSPQISRNITQGVWGEVSGWAVWELRGTSQVGKA